MTAAICSCGRPIVRNQWGAESDADFSARLASGRCRRKCVRDYPNSSDRPRPTLSLISAEYGRGGVAQVKEVPVRDAARLAFARSMKCCRCGMVEGIHAHHEQPEGQGTMGGKVSDWRTVPLCPLCHIFRHNNGRSFWGIVDVERVICQINAAYDNRGK